MWKSLRLVGSDEWIKDAIEGWTLVAITDGSYIKERYTHLCLAAFILECSKGTGRVFGSFPECSQGANAYWGELMGLMAIHLILLAANKVCPSADTWLECDAAVDLLLSLAPPRQSEYITARPLRLSQTLFADSRIKCIAIRPINSPRYAFAP